MAKETTTAKKSNSKAADNLLIYEKARTVPQYALKEIKAGRLNGMTDINPMFRIKRMTELFGPCGIGWKYEITRQWFESYGEEVKAFTNINLYYKLNGEWSEAIPGTVGSSFVAKEKSGAYVNDEGLKMALTDAISVATKALGIAADIYYAKDGRPLNPGDSKYQELTNESQKNKSDFDRLRAKYPNVFAAQTVDELMAIYQSNSHNVNDSDFMLALSARKKEVGG